MITLKRVIPETDAVVALIESTLKTNKLPDALCVDTSLTEIKKLFQRACDDALLSSEETDEVYEALNQTPAKKKWMPESDRNTLYTRLDEITGASPLSQSMCRLKKPEMRAIEIPAVS